MGVLHVMELQALEKACVARGQTSCGLFGLTVSGQRGRASLLHAVASSDPAQPSSAIWQEDECGFFLNVKLHVVAMF